MQLNMRYLIVLIACVFALSANAQRVAGTVFAVDTLDDTETNTFTWLAVIDDPGTLYFHVAGDSLSGATAGFCYYEVSLDAAGTEWTNVASDALNGVSIDETHIISNFAGRRARIRCVGVGTMSLELSPSISFKRQ